MRALADVILLLVPDLWTETQALQAHHSLSFWDALLVGACLREGVQTLHTEDIGAPPTIDCLSLVNPFLGPPIP
jgi:predicted nucleic acid-binding protein